jgi:tetratricopeptide (TPR) repeat protein
MRQPNVVAVKVRAFLAVACASLAALAALAVLGLATDAAAGVKWEGKVPSIAQRPEAWHQLIAELSAQSLYYGQLAAAQRALALFTDLETKELAYESVVDLIDRGYSFEIRSVFIAGDLEPRPTTDQAKSYYLYKGILNLEKGLEKWGSHYLAKIDRAEFPKYDFYRAVTAYAAGRLDEAEDILKKLLAADYPLDRAPFVRKLARTLARIHFERKQYVESLDIYRTFLLRLNPVTPADWLEASWNLYYLKRYDEALGYLYNLESKAAGPGVDLEKFVLRALVYRDLCNPSLMGHLLRDFDGAFGATIARIKNGDTLTRIGQLETLMIPENADQYARYVARRELRAERAYIERLSPKVRPLARYVYQAELKMLDQVTRMHAEAALRRSADYLVTLGESLHFLKFDVARERYNPDVVFQVDAEAPGPSAPAPSPYAALTGADGAPLDAFTFSWRQAGDFWRDERQSFRGGISSQCASY